VAVVPVDPMDLDFPHAETLVRVRRTSSAARTDAPLAGYYVSSLPCKTRTPAGWLELIRGHWGGVESRNHWRKDACLGEDRTRSRNPRIVGALALLRNTVLHFFNAQERLPSLPAFVEDNAANAAKTFRMLMEKAK
jgi:hypothetical protein